jgi:hypothetical protein
LPEPIAPGALPGVAAFYDAAEFALQNLPGILDSAIGRTIGAPLRRTYLHREFAAYIRSLDNPRYHAEVSYLRGVPVPCGTRGSIRADGIYGSISRPIFAVELKTGFAYVSRSEYRRYQENLPAGTALQVITIP